MPYLFVAACVAAGYEPPYLWILLLYPAAIGFSRTLVRAGSPAEGLVVREVGYLYWQLFMSAVLIAVDPTPLTAGVLLGLLVAGLEPLASPRSHADHHRGGGARLATRRGRRPQPVAGSREAVLAVHGRLPAGPAAVAIGALAGVGLWMRRHPSPVPYSQRRMLDLPKPVVTRKRLSGMIGPCAGQRLLEIGPGTGYYTVELARSVGSGAVDVLDVRREFLDHATRRAAERGAENVISTLGDVQALPYQDEVFDGAVVIGVLGEVPDQDAALSELRRVLKPGGRLVVGEFFPPDPHFQFFGPVGRRALAAGFTFRDRTGRGLGWLARFDA